ncbi:MAG: molybdopterin oxidoreductase, iron-sulfur binding subunit [Chthonomonadaceae bacterium]|nr:molybdopterin oxidoreductase, iron-sulfur binding subunit [Chthonomonadaceae bacterium]
MDIHPKRPVDARTFRAKLEGQSGKQYWRSLEELADTPEFREYLLDEIPQHTRSFDILTMDRRRFLTLAGASLALAGLSGCRWLPAKKVVPNSQQSEDRIISIPNIYATSVVEQGLATGVLVTSNEGRPTRIEGNPMHPASLGSNSSTVQATLLDLYDPERSQNILNRESAEDQGSIGTWPAFLDTMRNALAETKDGTGFRILTETVTSPTLTHQIKALLAKYPAAKWHQYEPCGRDNVLNGAKAAFGQPVNTLYDFSKADTILSLDADFLLSMPGHIRYSRDFATKRRVRSADISADDPKKLTMSRLYAVESCPAITGTMADHRLPLKASQVEAFARAVAVALGVDAGAAVVPTAVPKEWFDALVADLKAADGASIVITGDHQPPAVHVLCHAINAVLGNVGKTVNYTDPVEPQPVDQLASLRQLTDDMKIDGAVKVLLIVGGNPVYTAPVDLDFGRRVATTRLTAHISLQEDETSAVCKWHLPAAHSLEAWSDARAFDGTLSIIQPLIAPLYEGAHSELELLAALTGPMPNSYDVVYDYWKAQKPAPDFEKWWQETLHDGVVKNSAFATKPFTLNADAAKATVTPATGGGQGLELLLLPDPTVRDGRFNNNGWMQELPKPLTKLTWDNAALMSQATAEKLGLAPSVGGLTVADEKVVEFALGNQKLKIPVLVLPGHPDDAVTIHLGYGRTHVGKIGMGTGFNGYLLRTTAAPYFAGGAKATATGDTYPLAHTRSHHSMEGRDILMEDSLEVFLKNPTFAQKESTKNPEIAVDDHQSAVADNGEGKQMSLYDPKDHEYKSDANAYAYSWGLSIDNNVCIGCNACVTACQNENNIPIVGKDQVQRGREMHWIRIDRYYRGPISNPHTFFEPVTCMHCENAPCEPVCPVAATVHSKEGINQMIYNRCVGTRYCSNNCPYKVRRFNFYKYTAGQPDPDKLNGNNDSPVLQLLSNPEVTVRGRGVMEKCSYCTQRINTARQTAKKEGRAIKDGEVVTACQQSCPTQAIVFGDVADKTTLVSKLKALPTNYMMLGELNTRPRTTYLARLRNPNPAIKADVENGPDTPVVE